ncbi:MAG: TraR/DksA family transcriptional regulator [Deltaproteobacteria bacterium]|nr:MAG: TraR/DksA family transcriptional regulator [Deltaproteobacteria bacterium]
MKSYKQQLLDLQNELLTSLKAGEKGARTVTLDQSSVGRLSRMGALQAQAIALESRRRQELKLQRVKSALQRIASGDFGICPRCGEDIDARRLNFDPTTPMCITCAQTLEK